MFATKQLSSFLGFVLIVGGVEAHFGTWAAAIFVGLWLLVWAEL